MAPLDPARTLARLRSTPRDLVALLATASAGALHRPRGDQWPPAVVVAHLADAELVYGYRLRTVIAGDQPYLPAYDERAWADRFAELETDVKETLARWRALRQANLRLLESLDDGEWGLSGRHAELGDQTVAQLAERMANHDAEHVDQIRAGLAV